MKTISAFLLAATLLFGAFPHAFAFELGKPAPALKAKLMNGDNFDLAEMSGKVVLINFWASWCGPCRQEMPALETYYLEHKDEGLRIVAIDMDDPDDQPAAKQVMSQYSFPAAFKGDANYKGYGRIWRMPMTFVIDRHGVLRKDGSVGDPKVDLPMLEKIVTPLLKAAP